MKKSIILSIIIVFILGIMGGTVNAASAGISASTTSVTVGQNIAITVNFGEKTSASQFTLNYDSSKFTYVSKTSSGSFSTTTKRFAYANMDGEADLGSVTFTFTAKEAGSVNFSISGLKISTASQDAFAPTVSKSSVTVTAKAKEEPKPEPKPDPTPTPDPKPEPKPDPTPTPDPGGNTNKPSGNTSTGGNTNTNTSKNNTVNNTNTTKNEVVNNTTSNQTPTDENSIDSNVIDNTVGNEIESGDNTIASTDDVKTNNTINYIIYGVIAVLAIAIIVTIIVIIRKRQQSK